MRWKAEVLMPGFAVIDLETTGIHAGYQHRIAEVGVVLLDDHLATEGSWCTLLHPKRDLGDSSAIHGLYASDLAGAPSFEEVAGDAFDLLGGRRLVAHNARFVFGFLAYEASRTDLPVIWPTPICTLLLASALGLPTRLPDLAAAVGVPHERAHAASDDAAAIAALFVELGPRGQDGIDAVAAGAAPFAPQPCATGSGRVWTRTDAALPRTNTTFLTRLASRVAHLPTIAGESASEAALTYADLLDRALEDRVLTDIEMVELLALADGWGLAASDLADIHLTYLTSLVGSALSDQILTNDEQRDLERVCDLLALNREELDRLVQAATPALRQGRSTSSAIDHELRGRTVCFTGACTCSISGEPLTRASAELLAASAGLVVAPRVTKQLDVLVVADPDTMSGKARKARDYGTRIIAERVFWSIIGVATD